MKNGRVVLVGGHTVLNALSKAPKLETATARDPRLENRSALTKSRPENRRG